jgi:hypothetical protein
VAALADFQVLVSRVGVTAQASVRALLACGDVIE